MTRLEELETGSAERTAAWHIDRLGVEILSPEAAAAYVGEWRHLAGDCLEPNGFLEPGFALAAARHLARDHPPHFVFVWDLRRKLIAVCPLQLPARLGSWAQLRVWTHEQAPLGVPLLDRMRGKEALAAILTYCQEHLPNTAGLMFPLLPINGPTAQLLATSVVAQGVFLFDAHQRAILRAGADPDWRHSISASRRRNLRRARRALEARGALTFRLLREPGELRVAAEEFLTLEAKGWKGRRGTALLQSTARTAFARSMMSALSSEGKLSIARLDCGGVPIGMTIVVESGGRAFYWKVAYDEEFAVFSPGVLVSLELTRALLDDARIALTDSCATPDHPMIDHLWRERMAIADFFVALATSRKKGFYTALMRESAYRSLRGLLKEIAPHVRRMKRASKRSAPKA
jgi:CelD/BcsL family acetyltransferase involved in cellulose biosynthesis